jgi:hypothetical protein
MDGLNKEKHPKPPNPLALKEPTGFFLLRGAFMAALDNQQKDS